MKTINKTTLENENETLIHNQNEDFQDKNESHHSNNRKYGDKSSPIFISTVKVI